VKGKRTRSAIYFHISAEDTVLPILRARIDKAKPAIKIEYNVIKLHKDKDCVSFLYYENFDEDPHPKLRQGQTSYSAGGGVIHGHNHNPPILHRKELLVSEDYPHYQKFKELTKQEEKRGLLGRPDIGFLEQWKRLLKKKRLKIVGHKLVKIPKVKSLNED
jgi:DNA phosphorothioation-associated putative methyltransferase